VNRLSINGSATGAMVRACSVSVQPSHTHIPTLRTAIITSAEKIDVTPPKNVNTNLEYSFRYRYPNPRGTMFIVAARVVFFI
jgi:hypothetical protein